MEVRSQYHTPAALSQENSPRYDWLSGWVGQEVWGGGGEENSLTCAGIQNPSLQALRLVSVPTTLLRPLRICMSGFFFVTKRKLVSAIDTYIHIHIP